MTALDLSKLESRAKTINQSTDQLNEALAEIERKLASLNLGVECFIEYGGHYRLEEEATTYEGETGWTYFAELGFGKSGNEWCLLARHGFERGGGDDGEEYRQAEVDVCPLLKSPRKLRVRAVQLIPELIKKIESETDALATAVEEAKKLATDL